MIGLGATEKCSTSNTDVHFFVVYTLQSQFRCIDTTPTTLPTHMAGTCMQCLTFSPRRRGWTFVDMFVNAVKVVLHFVD